MKPLTGPELAALPDGTKLRLHPKYIAYCIDVYKTNAAIVRSVYTLMETKTRKDGLVDFVALNDRYPDERVKSVIDKYGWGVSTLKPMLILASSATSSSGSSSSSPQSSDDGYCSCDDPDLDTVTYAPGKEYDYCRKCKKERK